MEKAIIRTVIRVMLPLGTDATSREAQETANQILLKVVTPAPGKMEAELSSNVARRMLGVMLAQMGYPNRPSQNENRKRDRCPCGIRTSHWRVSKRQRTGAFQDASRSPGRSKLPPGFGPRQPSAAFPRHRHAIRVHPCPSVVKNSNANCPHRPSQNEYRKRDRCPCGIRNAECATSPSRLRVRSIRLRRSGFREKAAI